MSTSKLISANRANALASTGPKTSAGKAMVALNATKLGIYALRPVVEGMESAADWEAFRAGILDDLAPVGAMERVLAECVAGCFWRLGRVTKYEADVIYSNRKDWLEQAPADEPIVSALRQNLPKARSNVDAARETADIWKRAATFFECMETADGDDAMDGTSCINSFGKPLGNCSPDFNDVDAVEFLGDSEFLRAVRPPADSNGDADPWQKPGWTIHHARRAVTHLMEDRPIRKPHFAANDPKPFMNCNVSRQPAPVPSFRRQRLLT